MSGCKEKNTPPLDAPVAAVSPSELNTPFSHNLNKIMHNTQFLCLADMHDDEVAYQLLADLDVMKALAASGVKTLFFEMLDYEEELVLQAAADGKITFQQASLYLNMDHVADDLIGSKRISTAALVRVERMIPTIAENAGKFGIKIRSVERDQGSFPVDQIPRIETLQKRYAEYFIKKFQEDLIAGHPSDLQLIRQRFLEENPNYSTELDQISELAEDYIFKQFSTKALEKLQQETGFDQAKGKNQDWPSIRQKLHERLNSFQPLPETSERVKQILEQTSSLEDQQAALKLLEMYLQILGLNEVVKNRLRQDAWLAHQISEKSNSEKAVIVYGMMHYKHAQSIDTTLGLDHSKVLFIFRDERENQARVNQYRDFYSKAVDIPLMGNFDFTFDVATGSWKNLKTGENSILNIPLVYEQKNDTLIFSAPGPG